LYTATAYVSLLAKENDMADLQCKVRNLGCGGKADYVCHHCGKPVCKQCDKEMVDHQFARPTWRKAYPKAHHCPDCYHPSGVNALFKGKTLKIRKYLRKFSF
jgi:hypothetical protein